MVIPVKYWIPRSSSFHEDASVSKKHACVLPFGISWMGMSNTLHFEHLGLE